MLKEFCGYDETKYDLYKKEKKEKIRKFIFEMLVWLCSITLLIFCAYYINFKCLAKTTVVNDSMEPGLSKNDKILVNVAAYKISSPDRYDVCVIKRGDDEHIIYDVKRIYGLPGETILIKDGVFYADNKPVEDIIATADLTLAGVAMDAYVLGEDEYFVLSDDRTKEDSRFASYGKVSKEDLLGKAFIRTNKFGFINKFNKDKSNNEEDKKF